MCKVRMATCGREEFPAIGVPEKALKELGCGVRYEELGCELVAVILRGYPTPAAEALLEVWECDSDEQWVLQCVVVGGRIHSCRCVNEWCGMAEEIVDKEAILREGVFCLDDVLRQGSAGPL